MPRMMPEKDPALLALLHRLEAQFGTDAFELEDHWSADLLAVGIRRAGKPGRVAYLAVDRSDGSYYVALEEPSAHDATVPRTRAWEFTEGQFPETALEIGQHFELPGRQESDVPPAG